MDTANYADLVMDAKTGRILHSTSPDDLRHPASLTKMMTLYLTFQALKRGQLELEQRLSISQHAASQAPSKLGLRGGNTIRVEDALLGLVTKSANDATVVIAEALGGTEEGFARMMTNKARELGMQRTVFRNASGLHDPEQVTTARDMAILGYALIYHHPQFYPYFSREGFTYAGVRHNNHNNLMKRYQGMDGIKTGYIRASGFNLVASTVRGSTRLIAVVFGGRSAVLRDNRIAALMDQAFAGIQTGQTPHRASLDGTQQPGGGSVSVPAKGSATGQHVAHRTDD
ncbi:MAG: D-alanyl-D-alanine carboxypeptidase [Magnetococcales bacterium]|nr:D-alanyl-D-alanine carboxypeptidase [Magnetococcales bacterium]